MRGRFLSDVAIQEGDRILPTVARRCHELVRTSLLASKGLPVTFPILVTIAQPNFKVILVLFHLPWVIRDNYFFRAD